MNVFVSFEVDGLDRQVGHARMSDDVAEVRRANQAIQHGSEIWKSFALRTMGNVIEIGGDEGAIEISVDHLPEVPSIQKQYEEAVGATVSVGIGMKLSESAKALMVAKLRGGRMVLLWNPEMAAEIEAASKQTEQAKIVEEYLHKATGGNPGEHGGFSGHEAPGAPSKDKPTKGQGPHEEGQVVQGVVDGGPPPPEATHAAADFEDELHDHASAGEKADQDNEVQGDKHIDELKGQVAQVLLSVKQQIPVLSQMRQAAPEAFSAIMNLVQAVVALGREVTADDQPQVDHQPPVQKAELAKAIGELPPGKFTGEYDQRAKYAGPEWRDTVKSYDYNHLLPQHARDAGLKMGVEHRFLAHKSGATQNERFVAHLSSPHDGIIGKVTGIVRSKTLPAGHPSGASTVEAIEPHSELAEGFRGKGLGTAMYEALYSHAKNVVGINHVKGGIHSADAHALHQRLAAKHGFKYSAEKTDDADYPYDGYRYTLKQELEPDHDHLLIGPHRGLVFQRDGLHDMAASPATQEGGITAKSGGPIPGQQPSNHLHLPEGSQVNGKIKVTHADGSSSWVEMRAGAVQGQEADAPLYGANSHPVSAKEPGAR